MRAKFGTWRMFSVVMLSLACGAFAAEPSDVRWSAAPDTDMVFQPVQYGRGEWDLRREKLQMQVRVAAGLWPEPERTPLNPKIFGRLERDGYTIEKVHFESYPGFYVTGNLYRPRGVQGKRPAVACPHGHFKDGRLHHDEVGSIPARCITLAKLGAVVFAYDMLGWNDGKRQIDHRIDTPARDLWGITSLHLQTWNSIRVLDFLQSLPDVDPERIGVTGASGGGTQTFILYAVDNRVKVAAPVNMISHLMQGGCVCENAPCLRIDTNNMEIGALMAPRPLLMVSATGDWTKDTPKVEYPFTRGIYDLYNAGDKVRNVHVDAGHNYNKASREAMYRFFGTWLLNLPDAEKLTEPEIGYEKDEDMLVWTDETYPKKAPNLEQLTEQLKSAATARMGGMRPEKAADLDRLGEVVRTGLQSILATSWESPVKLKAAPGGPGGIFLIVEHAGRVVKATRKGEPGGQASALRVVFSPEGMHAPAAVEPSEVVILPEPFGTGANRPPVEAKRGSTKFFTTFNRCDAAETVGDMIAAMKAAFSSFGPKWQLVGEGELGPAALVARAMMTPGIVARNHLRTVIDMNGLDVDSDDAYLKGLNLPHVRRLGGLRAIAAVACNGPIWFHNTGGHLDEAWVKAAGRISGVEVRVTREKAEEKEIAAWLQQQ